jgi:hypothetical protein
MTIDHDLLREANAIYRLQRTTSLPELERAVATYVQCALTPGCRNAKKHQHQIDALMKRINELRPEVPQ